MNPAQFTAAINALNNGAVVPFGTQLRVYLDGGQVLDGGFIAMPASDMLVLDWQHTTSGAHNHVVVRVENIIAIGKL